MKRSPTNTAASTFANWRDDLFSGREPVVYRMAATGPLADLEIGPGRVVLLGGPPGTGKSALAMQLVVDALRLDTDLRAVACSVEMPPEAQFDRQLARLSGINATTIRKRELTPEHKPRIESALVTLEAIVQRLAFAGPPFDLEMVAKSADAVGAKLLLLDYVQRIAVKAGADDKSDRRGAVTATMDKLRDFAGAGAAILAVAAVGRSKDGSGRSSYSNLTLASYRETSELEYGCDDAFLLVPDSDSEPPNGDVLLRQEKSRYGERLTIPLRFDGRYMRFSERPADANDMAAAVGRLWPTAPKGAA